MADTICETFKRQYKQNITGEDTAVRVYNVFLDSPRNTLKTVIDDAIAAGLPALGDFYIADDTTSSFLVATQYTPREVKMEKSFYIIEVLYETSRTIFASPADRPWNITFSSESEEYVPEQTLFNSGTQFPIGQIKAVGINQPIMNKAGFPFDPPVTDIRHKTVITMEKNFLNISDIGSITDIDDLMSRVGTVNDDIVTIAGISLDYFEGLLAGITCNFTEGDSEEYYATSFKIIIDREYHVQKIVNASWQDAAGNAILGDRGGTISNPWVIDAAGAPIRGNPANRAANTIYYAFGTKTLSSFGDLSLKTTFN